MKTATSGDDRERIFDALKLVGKILGVIIVGWVLVALLFIVSNK